MDILHKIVYLPGLEKFFLAVSTSVALTAPALLPQALRI
jgi:hypothetical protein